MTQNESPRWPTPAAVARELGDAIDFSDHTDSMLEDRIIALEELVAARWPRRWILRRRLARRLRASSATFAWAGRTFQTRRVEAAGGELTDRTSRRPGGIVSDHYHGEYAEARHDHRGERTIEELRGQVREFRAILIEFGLDLSEAQGRIHALEGQTPEARQAEYEADIARADAGEDQADAPDCQAVSDAGTQCTGHDWHLLPHRDVNGYEWGEDA